jgi:hypothetical protein
MTGRDLVTASLRKIGAIAPGESLAAAEAVDALAELNRMIGGWGTEGLLIYKTTRDSLTLVVGTAAYTMGTGGTFNVARPQQIVEVLVRDETQSPALEYPVNVLSTSDWAAITQKDVSSAYPTDMQDDGGYPYRTLTFHPKPSVAHKIITFSLKPLTEIATLDTVVSVPPGYDEALIYNLAIRLAPEYGKAVPDAVNMIAIESKAGLKRMNRQPSLLQVDDALLVVGRQFNIYTGGN